MPAISVGSVEVDVLPNATGVRERMQRQLLPAADSVGDELGRVLGRYVTSHLARAVVQGVTTGGRQAQGAAGRQGQATGSTFARTFKARLEAALATLPEVRLRANSSDAEREIFQIRAQMRALADARIGIDVSTETANTAITVLQERLARLSASDADVAVRVDAGAAAAQLAAFQAEVNRLDGQTAHVDVDTRSAAANFNLLTTAALAFGPAILPVLPVVAAGLGAVAAAGVAAAAGIGGIALVAVPAFKGIASTLQAQKAAQDAATNATAQGGQAASQAASRTLQMASAQQQLASAERSGARQIAQAQQAVRQARQQAADTVAQAARKVQDAERSLADAQRDAKQAQTDLTAARRTAAQELEDINNRLADSVLSQRDAEIALKEATAQRDAVLNNANSTELDKQKALLAYDQAVQRLKEQTTETKRLKSETAAANKAGVEGSTTVTTAQNRLAEAQRKVADQQRAVRDAQVDSARQIADAQQRVSEATANVAVAQQSAADAVASAQRQIQSASLSAAGSVDQAAIAQAKYQAELAKLTPAARATMTAYTNLKTAFGEWAKSLQPQVMPIFTRALDGMRRSLPGITPLVTGAAAAIKGLQDRAAAGFRKPWWRTFKDDLDSSVKPAITGLGVAFGNVFKGMAGVIGAFLPHMDSISGHLEGVTKRFADWGTGLRGSASFERFLSYASEQGPKVWATLSKLFRALFDVARALAPVSAVALKVLGAIADGISWVAQKAPWLIQGVYALIVAWSLLNIVMSANPFSLIVIGVGLVIAALVYAYNRFGWFRTAVQAIGDMFVWLWRTIMKPYIEFIIAYWKMVGAAAMWLWQNAIKPAFNFIAQAAKILLTVLVVIVLLPIIATFKLLAAVGTWLWQNALAPAFRGIAAIAQWLYKNILKPNFQLAMGVFRAFADVAKWLYTNAVKPVFGWIADRATWLWDKGVRPAFDALKRGVKAVGDAFKTAKDYIGEQWSKVSSLARTPVQFVVDTVYNKGIVGVWNAVAGAFGAPKLKTFKFAAGGVMPGYTPGRDVHKFVSPTGGRLELSGGESIMRPEFTRAVGAGFVNSMNAIARSRGAQGIKAALAPAFGGNPPTPTDTSLRYAGGGVVQSFADGGIFGWLKSAGAAAKGAGSAAWNKVKESASWLKDTLEASARAGMKDVVNPLLASFPGMDTGFGKLIRHIPNKIIDALFGYTKKADEQGGGGLGGPKIQAALRWAKTQAGLPYQWAGNGNPSWDCSGFMSAIESVLRGQKPHRRWATMAFSGKTAPPGWVYHGNSPFKIGITNAGVGHTAGTLGGTNVESRGGDGLVVGPRARGYNNPLFTSWYGFKPGSFDSGGYLQPGLNLAYNGTGRPEPVFTRQQASALGSMASRGPSGPASFEGDLYLDSGEFLGKVRGEATAVVHQEQQRLISVINAS